MRDKFISAPNSGGKKYLREIEDVENAVNALFWFRAYAGLEDYSYNYDYMDWSEYDSSMCSQNT